MLLPDIPETGTWSTYQRNLKTRGRNPPFEVNIMNVLVTEPITLSSDTIYINPGHTCRIVGAYNVVSGTVNSGNEQVITISDGTTDVGTITIAASAAVGTVDKMVLDTTSKGAVEFNVDTPIKLVAAGTSTGLGNVTLVLDAYHADC